MKVLVADDDPVSLRLLQMSLMNAGYAVITSSNGNEALRLLEQKDGPELAVLDWMMPEMDGVEVCRIIRAKAREPYMFTFCCLRREGTRPRLFKALKRVQTTI